MRKLIFFVASAIVVYPAFAELVMRSSNPQGVQVQGNADLRAQQETTTAAALGQSNEARNTAGAIKGGTQIRGNTSIKAQQSNATAVAVGKDNKATNEAGVIGGR
jgi:hypothetical protein